MAVFRSVKEEGKTLTIVSSIPSEDVIVRSEIDYIPQFVTDVYGETDRVTKDVTLVKLLRQIQELYPNHQLVSIGTPVNFDVAPSHLTRVEMQFKSDAQVEACLKEIAVSDALIRTRVQPSWDWQAPALHKRHVILHVGWYDTVYFMQNRDIFLGALHCRYSAKFQFDPKDANLTHFRYTATGEIEEISELNSEEKYAESIKDKVEFIRVFRDGTREKT